MSNYQCYTDTSSNIIDCTVEGLHAGAGGAEVLGLLTASVLIVSFYVASNGGVAAAAVLTSVAGGVLVTTLPTQFQSTAQIVMFAGLVGAILALANRYVLEV
jgi:hypothetical protein